MILSAGLFLECQNLSPTGLLLAVFELPVPLRFLLVSCIAIWSCSIRNARVNTFPRVLYYNFERKVMR
jgi:hypothetical protein